MKLQYLYYLIIFSIFLYILYFTIDFILLKFTICNYNKEYCKECSHSKFPGCKLSKGCVCISGCQCKSGNCNGSCV